MVLFTALAVVFACGCTKTDEPDNGGGSNNGGGSGGGNNGGNAISHEYVDLGLPSGTLWATCNMGANSPEEKGDYFAWGETETKEFNWNSYSENWNNYKFGRYPITKYNEQDNLTILYAEDDAASVNWGDGWYTPTYEQWQELLANTEGWSENVGKGVHITASNGQSIFLPLDWPGFPRKGFYMCNSLFPYSSIYYDSYFTGGYVTYAENAWGFQVGFNHHGELYWLGLDAFERSNPFYIRPVRSANNNENYRISASANDYHNGEVSGGGIYQQGETCTLTARAYYESTFSMWTENGVQVSTDVNYTFAVNGNRTLVAVFE